MLHSGPRWQLLNSLQEQSHVRASCRNANGRWLMQKQPWAGPINQEMGRSAQDGVFSPGGYQIIHRLQVGERSMFRTQDVKSWDLNLGGLKTLNHLILLELIWTLFPHPDLLQTLRKHQDIIIWLAGAEMYNWVSSVYWLHAYYGSNSGASCKQKWRLDHSSPTTNWNQPWRKEGLLNNTMLPAGKLIQKIACSIVLKATKRSRGNQLVQFHWIP